MNEEGVKKYEISLLLRSEEVAEPVLTALKNSGAVVEEKSQPAKIKLAYPIKKEVSAYFMCAVFSCAPEAVLKLQEELKHQPEILRFLVVTPPILKEERRDRDRNFSSKPRPSSEPIERPRREEEPRPQPQQPEIVSNELLEKKLEEILG